MVPILTIGFPKCSLLFRSIWVILSTATGRNILNKKSPAKHHFLLPKERIKQPRDYTPESTKLNEEIIGFARFANNVFPGLLLKKELCTSVEIIKTESIKRYILDWMVHVSR